MADFVIETPYLTEQATVSFFHEPTRLQTYLAEQLGVNYTDITLTGGSAESGANVFFQSTNYVGYDPADDFTGTDTVTLTYRNNIDGSTGTISYDYLVIATDSEFFDNTDGGESELRPYGATYSPGVVRSGGGVADQTLYYGYDNYITYEELLSSLTDTFGEQAKVVSVERVYLAPNGDTRDATIEFQDNGEYITIDADTLGDSEYNTPYNISNRAVLVEVIVEDDALGTFRYSTAFVADPAPAGYVQPLPPEPITEPIIPSGPNILLEKGIASQYLEEGIIEEFLASEIGSSSKEIEIVSYGNIQGDLEIDPGTSSQTAIVYKSNTLGQSSVDYVVQNTTTGETQTVTLDFITVEDGFTTNDNFSGRGGTTRSNIVPDSSTSNVYFGEKIYVTKEDILSSYSDLSPDATVEVTSATFGQFSNRQQNNVVDIVEVADGVWSTDTILEAPIENQIKGIFYLNVNITDPSTGFSFSDYSTFLLEDAPEGYVDPYEPVLFEGYDPLNNWQPQRRVEINPGGPAAESLGDELVINDANGRLFGINNRASDSTFDEITNVAFVMGETGVFDDGTIAGKEYVGTLEFDLQEGYRTTANFNTGQLAPVAGYISPEGTLDGAMVSTETGEVLALFEDVTVI